MITLPLILFVIINAQFAEIDAKFKLNNDKSFRDRTKIKNNQAVGNISLKYFEVPVDHFNKTDNRMWKMQYSERLDFFANNGPLYIFINGEWPLDDYFLQYGLIVDLANETSGAMFGTEHRYYGESLPLGKRGHRTLKEYYKYLSSRQALADIADFVKYLKKQPQYRESKVVMIGASYSGNLAAWFRLVYPDLAVAALASSAPVQATEDYHQYLETVTDVYRQYGGKKCVKYVNKTFFEFSVDYKSDQGIDKIKHEYNICPDCNITGWIQYLLLYHIVFDKYAEGVQAGDYSTLIEQCFKAYRTPSILTSANCTEISMQYYNEPDPWMYQKCNEFGYFKTTDGDLQKQIFWGVPIDMYHRMCETTFGINKTEIANSIRKTNEYYGGRNTNVSNVLFVNGGNDPWHHLGVLKSTNTSIAIIIPDGYHISDLEGAHKDYAEKEKKIIKKWLGIF